MSNYRYRVYNGTSYRVYFHLNGTMNIFTKNGYLLLGGITNTGTIWHMHGIIHNIIGLDHPFYKEVYHDSV